MEEPKPVASVIRVPRHDTIMVRTPLPQSQAYATIHLTPFGITCSERAKEEIVDWVEVHADAGRLVLITVEWLRDDYGRVVGDLADPQSGETLSGWLVAQGVAEERPGHLHDILSSGFDAYEPEV